MKPNAKVVEPGHTTDRNHIVISLNGANLEIGRPDKRIAEKTLRRHVKDAGLDWDEIELMVPNFPEHGRYLRKTPGYPYFSGG